MSKDGGLDYYGTFLAVCKEAAFSGIQVPTAAVMLHFSDVCTNFQRITHCHPL